MIPVIAFFGLAQRGNSPEALRAALELNQVRKDNLLSKVTLARQDRLEVITAIGKEVAELNQIATQFANTPAVEDDAA